MEECKYHPINQRYSISLIYPHAMLFIF